MKHFIKLTNEAGTEYYFNVHEICRFLLEPGRTLTSVYPCGEKAALNAKETVAQIIDLIKASQA